MRDEELLAAWRGGDREAGNQLVERHFSTVYRFFRSKLDHDVEDLAQRTFEAALQGLERLRKDDEFRAYLLGIARHVLYRQYRKRRNEAKLDDFLIVSADDVRGSPSQLVALAQGRRRLVLCLRSIPLDAQICLELRYWEGMSVDGIARVLDVPPGTVKSRLHRAREQLRARLAEVEPDAERLETTLAGLERWRAELRDAFKRSGDP